MKINLSISLIILFMAFYHVASAQNWKLTGNAATSPATDFLGTTDTKGLAFRTNNIERMRVSNSGRIGIGTISPAYFMHVFGTTQIENNSKTIYDEPLFSIRSSAANGPTSNPSIAFKVEDTTFALMGYDCSTKDIILSTKEPLYVPNLVINHANGFTGLNSKTPAAQLDINSNSFDDALRVQVDSSTKLFVGDRGGVSIGAYVQGPTNGLYVAGNTGLGITQPVYRLDVTGTSRFQVTWAYKQCQAREHCR